MNVLHDDIDSVAESLESLAFAIWNALRHPDGIQGQEIAGAAGILSGLLHEFAQRLKNQKVAGTAPAPEDPTF